MFLIVLNRDAPLLHIERLKDSSVPINNLTDWLWDSQLCYVPVL